MNDERATRKITRAYAVVTGWREGAIEWAELQLGLVALGFYRILRGSKPRQVFAYLDGVLYEL